MLRGFCENQRDPLVRVRRPGWCVNRGTRVPLARVLDRRSRPDYALGVAVMLLFKEHGV